MAKKKQKKLSPFARQRLELEEARHLNAKLASEVKDLRGANDFLNKRLDREIARNGDLRDNERILLSRLALAEGDLKQARHVIGEMRHRDRVLGSRLASERLQAIARISELERLGFAIDQNIATDHALQVPAPLLQKDATIRATGWETNPVGWAQEFYGKPSSESSNWNVRVTADWDANAAQQAEVRPAS